MTLRHIPSSPATQADFRISPLRVLYLGPISGTSGHRIATLRRMGHSVTVVDPHEIIPSARIFGYLEWKMAPEVLASIARRHIVRQTLRKNFDVTFVDGGSLVSGRLLRQLSDFAGYSILFNHDDPFGPRDRVRFRVLREAAKHYDLFTVVRLPNVAEAWRAGARNVMLTVRTSDTVAHGALSITAEDAERWDSKVCFIGTWMGDRGAFLTKLIDAGVPLTIYGNSWERAPEWNKLQRYWKGGQLDGNDYIKAIQCAKVCIGLLSSENRDLHTTRSLEVPRLGSLFCAQRTSEHEAMYVDGVEAVFWANAEECAEKCLWLLSDEQVRSEIARKGQERALRDQRSNDQLFHNTWSALHAIHSKRVSGGGDGQYFNHFTA